MGSPLTLPLTLLISAANAADLKTWIELVTLIALAGAFINEVRVMGKMLREHSSQIKALERQVLVLKRIETALGYINREIGRLNATLTAHLLTSKHDGVN